MKGLSAFGRRLVALTRKEFAQLLRDNSSLLMGVVLPLVLIFIIGYGMSLDVDRVPTAVVLAEDSPTTRSAASFTVGSRYFEPVYVHSRRGGNDRDVGTGLRTGGGADLGSESGGSACRAGAGQRGAACLV